MASIRHPKDFASGVMFVGFGVASLVIGSGYPMGTAARMGPGYFPAILGGLLIVFGVVLMLRALRIQGAPITIGNLRPVAIVLGSVVLFGLLVNDAGLVVSSILLIVLSSSASSEFRWKESLVSGVVLAAGSVAAFVWGLGLQFSIWPAFIGAH